MWWDWLLVMLDVVVWCMDVVVYGLFVCCC